MEEFKQGYLQRLAALVEPVADAAEMLGASRQYVHQLISEGKLEAVKIGKNYFVGSLSLQEFMDARKAGCTPSTDARALAERGPGRTRASKAELSKGPAMMQP